METSSCSESWISWTTRKYRGCSSFIATSSCDDRCWKCNASVVMVFAVLNGQCCWRIVCSSTTFSNGFAQIFIRLIVVNDYQPEQICVETILIVCAFSHFLLLCLLFFYSRTHARVSLTLYICIKQYTVNEKKCKYVRWLFCFNRFIANRKS